MLALAGYPLGLHFRFFDPAASAPAGHLAELRSGEWQDAEALSRFAEDLDVVTYEFENVPVEAVELLANHVPIQPGPAALRIAQNRIEEKRCFSRLGIPTAPFAPVDSREALTAAVEEIGMPSVLKTVRLGYDGKGQAVIRTDADVERAWSTLGGVPLILEAFVPFDRELSVLAVGGPDGGRAFYPLVENVHRAGILHRSVAPAQGTSEALHALAEGYAARLMSELDFVGVMALELFQVGSTVLANELAPRVHNSGHWTIEGAATSQFENHLRAVLGLPLGPTAALGWSGMINLIGKTPGLRELLAIPEAHVHLYGKNARAGRKLGHVTVRADDLSVLRERLERVETLVSPAMAG